MWLNTPSGEQNRVLVTGVGPLATRNCESGQAWKGAAAAVDSGAEVWLASVASIFTDIKACFVALCALCVDSQCHVLCWRLHPLILYICSFYSTRISADSR